MGSNKKLLTTDPGERGAPHSVVARVHLCVPEFHVVIVRTPDDFQYALTPDTPGVNLKELRVGQTIECVVSAGMPRILSAALQDS